MMTIVYLAWSMSGHETIRKLKEDQPVDLLVAYPELKNFEKVRGEYNIRYWCMDSGAFGVWNSGKTIDLKEYTAACKDVDANEIFGLDVIENPEATRANLEYQWEQGVPAIPTFHGTKAVAGKHDPFWVLEWAAENSEKIALSHSGKRRVQWLQHAFSKIWPKPVHGFGMTDQKAMKAVPFHSVDSTTWIYAPAAMGNYTGYNGKQQRVGARGIKDYRVEVEHFQRLHKHYAFRHRYALKELDYDIEAVKTR